MVFARFSLVVLIASFCCSAFNKSFVKAAEIDFAHDVVPILKKHCVECHTGDKSEGGFSFSTHKLLLDSGYAEAGKPDDSRIVELIQSSDPDDQMPPADKPRLSKKEISVLHSWIAEGLAWEPGFRFGEAAWEPPLKPRTVDLPAAEFVGTESCRQAAWPVHKTTRRSCPLAG